MSNYRDDDIILISQWFKLYTYYLVMKLDNRKRKLNKVHKIIKDH